MKKLIHVLALMFGTLSLSAHAADASCEQRATDKKLADAAEAACDTQADERKLAGAAKTSFVTKCSADRTK